MQKIFFDIKLILFLQFIASDKTVKINYLLDILDLMI
jgi:hypothetical protein